jgi:hypothetical protein
MIESGKSKYLAKGHSESNTRNLDSSARLNISVSSFMLPTPSLAPSNARNPASFHYQNDTARHSLMPREAALETRMRVQTRTRMPLVFHTCDGHPTLGFTTSAEACPPAPQAVLLGCAWLFPI